MYPLNPPALGKALKMIYRPFPTTNRVKDSAVAVALIFLQGFKKMSWTLLLILSTFSGSHFCTHCHLYSAPLYQTFYPISLFSTKLLGKCHLNKALKINKLVLCSILLSRKQKVHYHKLLNIYKTAYTRPNTNKWYLFRIVWTRPLNSNTYRVNLRG